LLSITRESLSSHTIANSFEKWNNGASDWGRAMRNIRFRWFSLALAVGLACWIGWSDGAVVAQPQSLAPIARREIPAILIAQTPTEVPATVDNSKLSEADLLKLTPLKLPIKVSIGLYMSNLAQLDQTSETFDAAGYLMYTWRDSRLAYKPQQQETSRASSLDKIWHPAIEMVNFKSSTNSDTSIDILPDGTVLAQERFAKTLSSGLTLQKFPFDRQLLQIILESLKYDDRTVELVADSPKISIGTDSFVALSEWKIGAVTGTNDKSFFPPENQYYSRITVQVPVTRNYGFYVLKVMMPLLMITIASWSVFWIDPREFSTQIGIAFTNLLTVVALLLVINDTLPHVSYLTMMDGFTMICFLTILVAILVLIIAHRSTTKDNHHRAHKVQMLARSIVPIGFILSNLFLVVTMNFI
jgi:Neurotransmitter-gated ion-channel ligand binding domain/Neurotransmitter-gated ion-channel transmembrane region